MLRNIYPCSQRGDGGLISGMRRIWLTGFGFLALAVVTRSAAQITFEDGGAGGPGLSPSAETSASPSPTATPLAPVIEARLVGIVPTLTVENLTRAKDFYTRKLGFQLFLTSGSDYASVARDTIQLGLAEVKTRTAAQRGSCYFLVSGIDQFFDEIKKRGVAIEKTIETKPSKMREFAILDPDGNTLMFGEFMGQ
ncbi:MAG: hypothetical protein Fur0032_08050 [Terrimicrobiaceae bacterium]